MTVRRPIHADFIHTQFVEPAEFHKLMLSCRKMERVDSPSKDLRGLVDPATKTRYLIEAAKLFRRPA